MNAVADEAVAYSDVQTEFDSQIGDVPNMGEGAPIADAGNVAAVVDDLALGWPPELFGMLLDLVHRAVSEKLALTDREREVLGKCAKRAWDTVQDPASQGPWGALIAAELTIVSAKLGIAEVLKMLKKNSAALKTANTIMPASPAGSSSPANREAENPGLWNPQSSDAVASL